MALKLFRVYIALLLIGVCYGTGETGINEKILGEGTYWETKLYSVSGESGGPTVWIVGGMHGDELAGYQAATIVKEWSIDCGELVIIPEANAEAVRWGTRESSLGNLNRAFPRRAGERAEHDLAQAIWQEFLNSTPDFLLDLHEGDSFHITTSSSVGQSIIVASYFNPNLAGFAQELVKQLNEGIPASRQFVVIDDCPVYGSLALAAVFHGVEAAIFESCVRDPLEKRLQYQLTAVRMLLDRVGISVIGGQD